MLEALCGNKNVQRILLFLFVNGKCYGTQLSRTLRCPLTPLQKALLRLERGGIITRFSEGKTCLFRFNPVYPLMGELEQLLKKAYTLLSASEKKKYYVIQEESPLITQKKRMDVLAALWEKLLGVTRLTFHAKTRSNEDTGWNGRGQGEVVVTKAENNVLIFNEKGSWKDKQEVEFTFSNIFRWTLDRHLGVISLEHLRRGPAHPVFLFHMAPSGTQQLASIDSHLCEGDIYLGQLSFERYSLRLNWRVIGPKKNEEVEYSYS